MSEQDIFDELEKSIDDAFKPDEKERVKIKKSKKGYMFNEVYDQLLRNKWEAERIERERSSSHYTTYHNPDGNHSHRWVDNSHRMVDTYDSYIRRDKMHCRKCDNDIDVMTKVQEQDSMRVHSTLNRPIEYKTSQFFCPICGEYFRVIGEVLKIDAEVKKGWQ